MPKILAYFFTFFLLTFAALSLAMAKPVELGIDVLETTGFQCLKNKRIALLTHPAGVNSRGESTVDVLYRNPSVQLVALFGPEHGIRGDHAAEKSVAHTKDPKTGLPVYSLYGATRRPTDKMLEGIDLMLVDFQDIGVRSYTYVSCLCYVMEACFKKKIPLIVLDRPNPLGGLLVDGPIREDKWQSYVGYLPIPYVHGLTIGELAHMALNKSWLSLSASEKKEALRKHYLTIIPMRGWKRSMTWEQTRLNWVPTSPNIPTAASALGYAMTGLGAQLGGFRHGIGTDYPFRLLSFPGKSAGEVQAALASKQIPGLRFEIREAKKKNQSKAIQGVYVSVEDWSKLHPTELSLYMMQLAAFWNQKNPFAAASKNEAELFNKHVGSSAWWNALCQEGADISVQTFENLWTQEARAFQEMSRTYYLY